MMTIAGDAYCVQWLIFLPWLLSMFYVWSTIASIIDKIIANITIIANIMS